MKLIINGQPQEVATDITLQVLLESQRIAPNSIALVRNGVITPRSSWHTTQCLPNDHIDIFSAVAGG
ncbi:sulfur carrier protein ThiS [Shewanella sp. C32]|uniref:Sulfur carrier protein ThiS n=1 Tax=Shewanella electrica TaxID=515560 RepID=A0ABT2FL43_9GAMM|nr:sulfur carrier protein ThiS [Shewanella electrica]MCH1923845.1 sulfur carrier protein ThiS [Shewanella electrica]MCS4557064.1 sulfur carrier protein ThiS [Shewanella electrica]